MRNTPDNGEPGHDYFAMLLRRAFVEGTLAMGERVFGDQELSVIGLTKIGTFNIPADPIKEGVCCKDVELWQRELPKPKVTEL